MEYYKQVVRDTLDEIVGDGYETREQVLARWEDGDTQDDFGNMTGSRKCNTWQAQEDLKEAGFPWDTELNDLVESVGYNIGELLEKGAEVVDVVLCELVCMSMIDELKTEK